MATPYTNGMRRPNRPGGAGLVRSVIARPLLERIKYEVDMTADMQAKYPDLAQKYKTAVFLNPDFPGGLEEARRTVFLMLAAYKQRHIARTGKTPRRVGLNPLVADQILLGALKPAVVDFLLSMNASISNPIRDIWPSRWDVIIDINLKFRERPDYQKDEEPGLLATRVSRSNPFNTDPRIAAKRSVARYIQQAKKACDVHDTSQCVDTFKTKLSNQYVFARLEGRVLLKLVQIDKDNGEEWADMALQLLQMKSEEERAAGRQPITADAAVERPHPRQFRAIHQIWPDFELQNCTHRSVRTVKADAAQNSFSAFGEGITWAVMDSGIDREHPHFAMHANIDRISPFHRDFTGVPKADPLVDEYGHGTHVAGIIAGQQTQAFTPPFPPAQRYREAWRLQAVERERKSIDNDGDDDDTPATAAKPQAKPLASIAGIAPKCKLVSLKVLDEFGNGKASNVIAAIGHIQTINSHGRDLKIHGVNLSLGHSFEAEWFACGHSPLCVEVNRLVKSGVVVVVAAGNTGYGMQGEHNGGLDLTINDPGNADLAITVGATHRDAPHRYGVSYFSSKGPTGDGRCKPDLVAPGEQIVSAAAVGSSMAADFNGRGPFAYCESSGTSMAAPHVSGAVAAFLSIRNEFVGEAEKVKQIFTSTATDLGREKYFQGAGLVDLLRAIQAV